MTHAEMDELYDLYAMGVLEPELAVEIEMHLAEDCPYCAEHVRDGIELSAALAGIADQRRPSAELRQRILARVSPVARHRSRNWVFAVAALAAACVALLVLAVTSRTQTQRDRSELATLRSELILLRTQLADVTAERDRLAGASIERNQLQAALAVLSKRGTRAIPFGSGESSAHGQVFVNGRGGLLFVGAKLPPLPDNRTFQLWIVPRKGSPRPAGVFRSNASGESLHVSASPLDPSDAKAVAVSIEPSQGSPAPTTTPILLVPLQ